MSALDTQVGGEHYKGRGIQPVEFISANKLNFLEGCIVKRIARWRTKNGLEDLLKIKHEVDLLIETEGLLKKGDGDGFAAPATEEARVGGIIELTTDEFGLIMKGWTLEQILGRRDVLALTKAVS